MQSGWMAEKPNLCVSNVCGIDSAVMPDDIPLLLIIDNSLSDGTVLLKYIPDDEESDDKTDVPQPVDKVMERI